MYLAEKIVKNIRHNRHVKGWSVLWDLLRPLYLSLMRLFFRKGIQRKINGVDKLFLLSKHRNINEIYEPEVWQNIMSELKPDDIFVDVGASIGLYSIAIAKRMGENGKVIAFEPERESFISLKKHTELNGVEARIRLTQAACGVEKKQVAFKADGVKSAMVASSIEDLSIETVDCTTLDSVFFEEKIDILKIDVEGFEEHVLKGGLNLIADPNRRPRRIYIEVHPFAWNSAGTTSDSLLKILFDNDYSVFDMAGNPITHINEYGEIVARSNV